MVSISDKEFSYYYYYYYYHHRRRRRRRRLHSAYLQGNRLLQIVGGFRLCQGKEIHPSP